MSTERISFTPDDMARKVAAKQELEKPQIATPREGDIIERDGKKLQWVKVPTGAEVWDSETQKLVPGYHSLRTWFSHHTEKVGPGPGWGRNLTLSELSPDEMQQRYGHVFTQDEILSPGGRWEADEAGEEHLTGGMPDDIPYYELDSLEAVDSDTLE